MLSHIMEATSHTQSELCKMPENPENISDRESSIESFHTNKSELSTTTETELIDIDDIELSDEESWLYKSPKKESSEDKSACTQKWLQSNVEDMDDIELKETRHALLSKLNQLKHRSKNTEEKNNSIVKALCPVRYVKKDVDCSDASCDPEKTMVSLKSKDVSSSSNGEQGAKTACQEWKCSQVLNVVDVQKIARLQEESLKQSTYKFLSHSGNRTPSSRDLSPVSPTQALNLNKPSSVEALNTCSERVNQSNVYSMVPLQSMKKQNLFNSSSALNSSQEFHHGSLPNINKGYYSLKSRKSKRPSEPKVSCPLPIYPTHSKTNLNGSSLQASPDHNKSFPSSYDHRQSNTLPSSYRVNSRRNSSNSRSNSSSRRDLNALSPSPRRESMPFAGNSSPLSNHRKFSSPVPSTIYPRYASSAVVSPTKAFNAQPLALRSPPGTAEYHRATSHSPARRLPLSMVQHQSPKRENNLRNGEIRELPVKLPSKIPNPAMRSGIPVPSTCATRPGDDTWNQDCF